MLSTIKAMPCHSLIEWLTYRVKATFPLYWTCAFVRNEARLYRGLNLGVLGIVQRSDCRTLSFIRASVVEGPSSFSASASFAFRFGPFSSTAGEEAEEEEEQPRDWLAWIRWTSSRVCGKGWPEVSGRKRVKRPTPMDTIPKRTFGSQ